MAGPDRESSSAVAVSLLLGFAAALVIALFEFRGSQIISRFAFRWEFAHAASLFSAWMPALLFAACAASMSLHREQGLRFAELLRPVLVPALILGLLFSALELTVLPGIRRTEASYGTLSRLFHDALKEAEEALQARDLPRAQERVALSGAIDRTEPAYMLLNERIQKAFLRAQQESDTDASVRTPPPPPPDTGASAYGFYKRARTYFLQGDFYSAHWYAGKALILDPSRRDARQLQAEAWDKITASTEDPADRTRADFHARKARAYALLQSGDYLGAYRSFTDLNKEDPKDPDVIRYRKESQDRLSETAFFADEYRRAFAGDSVEGFAVRVSDEGTDHVLFAARAAAAGPFLYMEDFEYLVSGPDGPTLHVQAPYVRLRVLSPSEGAPSGQKASVPACVASLRRVERSAPREASQPRYILGKSGPTGQALLVLPMDFESLATLMDLREEPGRISLLRLISGSKLAERYGWDPSWYRLEIAQRISIPVVLLILVLLGTALGARFRRGEEPGRLRLILTLPILTVLASVPLSAANRAGHYILGRLFTSLPTVGAVAVWMGFLAALLGLSLLAVGRIGVHASD